MGDEDDQEFTEELEELIDRRIEQKLKEQEDSNHTAQDIDAEQIAENVSNSRVSRRRFLKLLGIGAGTTALASSGAGANLLSGTTIGGSTAWHSGNDGSGSSLSADDVDGYHISVGSSKPSNPTNGELFFDTGQEGVWYYNGSGWARITGGGASPIPDSVVHRYEPVNYDGSSGDWIDSQGSTTLTAHGSPTILSNELNGEPVVFYDGSGDAHENTGLSMAQSLAFAFAFRIPTLGIGGSRVMGDPSESFHFQGDSGDSRIGMSAGNNLMGQQRNTNWHIVVAHFNTTNSELRIDGVTEASGDVGSVDMAEFYIAYTDHFDSYRDLELGELWLMDSPTSEDLSTAETYLNNRYAVF